MIQIPLTKGYTAVVDKEDAHLARHKWHAKVNPSKGVYARRGARLSDGTKYDCYLHREIMGLQPGDGVVVDHINGDGLDCRRSNLRIATDDANQRNIGGACKLSSSGFLGVYRQNSRWQAQIEVHGKKTHLGYFATPEEANVARLMVEKEVWGIQPRRLSAFQSAGLDAATPGGK